MRRKALGRGLTQLRRKTRLRARSRTNSHRRRERDLPFMAWVATLPCRLEFVGGRHVCRGRVQVDHAGNRFTDGNGIRAHDTTCIPLCTKHHRERTSYRGYFKNWVAAGMRAWCDEQIHLMRLDYAKFTATTTIITRNA